MRHRWLLTVLFLIVSSVTVSSNDNVQSFLGGLSGSERARAIEQLAEARAQQEADKRAQAAKTKKEKAKKSSEDKDLFDETSRVEQLFAEQIQQLISTSRKDSTLQLSKPFQDDEKIDSDNFSRLLDRARSQDRDEEETDDESEVQEEGINPSDPTHISRITSENIKQFGYDIFSRPLDTAIQKDDIPVGDDYLLGPGDTLIIYIWGKLEERFERTIDREGKIDLPKVGQVYLSKIKFGQVSDFIKNQLDQYYVNFDVNVSMGRLRSIRIYVLGDVERPGAYYLPSLASAFYGLYQAGGPSKNGSMRQIKLIRNGKTAKRIDLYDYLLHGNRSHDPKLQTGDTLFVSPIGPVAFIAGTVKRPGIYELKKGESVQKLIQNAGGLFGDTDVSRVQIHRIGNRKLLGKAQKTRLIDYQFTSRAELNTLLKKETPQDMDMVLLAPVVREAQNYVSISGAIYQPGTYAYVPKMTLSDLLKKADGFQDDAVQSRIHIYRFSEKPGHRLLSVDGTDKASLKTPLKHRDNIKVFRKKSIYAPETVIIEGAVRNPGEFELSEDMRLSDILFLAQLDPFAQLDEAELFRKTPGNLPEIINVSPKAAIDTPKGEADILLKPDDHLIIKLDSRYSKQRRIQLAGEFVYPGTYIIRDEERLSSVISRAGGFTSKAFLPGSVFTRASVRKQEFIGQAKILKEERKRLIYDQTKLNVNALDPRYQKALESREEALDLLQLKISENEGRIIVDLESIMESDESPSNLLLENGDRLFVSPMPSSVQVIGGVHRATSIVFIEGKSADYYIKQAGGYTEFAEEDTTIIFKANGSTSREKSQVNRGDTIYVPEAIRVPFNWAQMLINFADSLNKIALSLLAWKAVINDL